MQTRGFVRYYTRRGRALTVTQTVCIASRSLATGTYMHSASDAEKMSKNAVCCALRKVVLALTYRYHELIIHCQFYINYISESVMFVCM